MDSTTPLLVTSSDQSSPMGYSALSIDECLCTTNNNHNSSSNSNISFDDSTSNSARSVASSITAGVTSKENDCNVSNGDCQRDQLIKDGDGEYDNDTESNREIQSIIPPLHSGTIGMLGSVAIAVNSLTGPAMLNLPRLYQTAGFIPTTVTLALLCVLSTWCALHLANAISKVPGNINFRKEIEYSDIFRHYWGKRAFMLTHIAFFLCITCLNIASIVDTAQVVDQMLSKKINGGTAAISFQSASYVGAASPTAMPKMTDPDGNNDWDNNEEWNTNNHKIFMLSDYWEIIRWDQAVCMGEEHDPVNDDNDDDYGNDNDDNCIPFQDTSNNSSWFLTAGYILSAAIFLPMCLKDLKENTLFQIIGFLVLLVLSLQFIVAFIMNGIDISNVSLWGDDWSNLFGVCLFNFAVVLAIPAWLYEKKPSVNVVTAINGSSLMSFVLYVLVGSLGAMTMHNVSDNMLQSMMTGEFGEVTEISSMTFAFFIIGLGIPLFSVLTRLNLTGSGLCSEFKANLLAVYLPWGTAWMFYSGGSTSSLLGWGGIFFTSIIAFLAPLLVALHSVSAIDSDGSVSVYGNFVLTKRQQILSLYGLLIFSVVSIVLAVVGELYQN